MHLLENTPIAIKFAFFFMWFALIFAVIGVIIMPVIFNIVVIPKIEKKVGKKLKIRPMYNNFLFGNFTFRYMDIVGYITYKYLAWKIKGDSNAIKMSAEYGLGEVDYKVEEASRFELIMTLLADINFLLGTISLISMFVIVFIYR